MNIDQWKRNFSVKMVSFQFQWKLCVVCLLCGAYLKWALQHDALQSGDGNVKSFLQHALQVDFYVVLLQTSIGQYLCSCRTSVMLSSNVEYSASWWYHMTGVNEHHFSATRWIWRESSIDKDYGRPIICKFPVNNHQVGEYSSFCCSNNSRWRKVDYLASCTFIGFLCSMQYVSDLLF